MSTHYTSNRKWEYSNASGWSCYLELTPNSYKQFARKCVAVRGENLQTNLGS